MWDHDIETRLAIFLVLALSVRGLAAEETPAEFEPEDVRFFEQKIRPVLVDRCYRCHSAAAAKANKLKGSLRVDSRPGLLRGGESGPALLTFTGHKKRVDQVVWSADGDGVFYVSNARGGRDLYYQRVKGTRADDAPQRLTSGLKIHGIAADRGGRIAYSAWTTNVGIWSMPFPRSGPVSVSAAHPIMSTTESIEVVRVSPDGQWLAFDSDRSGNMDIFKMRIDGTGLQQLTHDSADDFRPSWSPDSREIAFHSWRSGNRDSYVIAADGSAERVIASGPAHEYSGTFSPDGSQIAFDSDRSGQIEIYIAGGGRGEAGGGARRLTTGGGSLARWSPDGKFIAYTITATNTPGVPYQAPLRVIPAEGGAVRTIPVPASLGQLVAIEGWSADGKKLYFRVIAPNGDRNIAEAPLDGGKPSILVRFDDPAKRSFNPFFSTDGKTIYFTLGSHEADIWVMDLRKK